MKQRIHLTEGQLNKIIKESVSNILNEEYFNPQNDEFDRNYFDETKMTALGIVNILNAMEDNGNKNDRQSIHYLYNQLIDRVNELNKDVKLLKNYFD